MAEISPGSLSRPLKKPRRQTQTTKQHRFEGFSRRIARLKIDPVHKISRKVQGVRPDTKETSHFRESLEEWTDLNLSADFTEFSRKATPLCETLPQLLYHADTLAAMLLEHIAKRDVLSLESLLSLLAHFAHDLGARFEKYFAESVQLVANVAATHGAPEAIEWSFTCLAWIFKFLSRLLVPDLRPLLAIMVDYLGKTHQREYITRFTAESMAFLIRKAGIVYQKDPKPLQNAVSYLLTSLTEINNERDLGTYKIGIMTLLADTIKGIDGTIHECGSAILHCSIQFVRSLQSSSPPAIDLLLGVWTNILHHVRAESSKSLIDLLQSYVTEVTAAQGSDRSSDIDLVISLAFLSIGLRKGSRIRDWASFNDTLLRLAQLRSGDGTSDVKEWQKLVTTLALSVCYSPLEGLFPLVKPLTEVMLSAEFVDYAVLFFSLLSKLCPERLSQFFVSPLQQFVNKHWKQREAALLEMFTEQGEATGESVLTAFDFVSINSEWARHMIKHIPNQSNSPEDAALANSYLIAIEGLKIDPKEQVELVKSLEQRIKTALDSRNASFSDYNIRVSLGRGLGVYSRLADSSGSLNNGLWKPLCGWALNNWCGFPAFWEALLVYLDLAKDLEEDTEEQSSDLDDQLLMNLLSDDLSIKQVSIEILQKRWHEAPGPVTEALSLCAEILATPYAIQSVRQLAMLLRSLVTLWQTFLVDSKYGKIIPHFLLGLLSPKSPQLHKEIGQALSTVCASSAGEERVTTIINQWLHTESEAQEDFDSVERPEEPKPFSSTFQCSNVESVKDLVGRSTERIFNAMKFLRDDFELHNSILNNGRPQARSMAITALKAVPQIAEKKSRQIVPLFLSSVNFENPTDWAPSSESSATSTTLSVPEKVKDWTRRDRKAMLELFAHFQNPRVLYRSADVYNALLDVLSKGDAEMQKLALNVIFNWKQPGIRPYQENLQNLTDDKRFRDELALFFHADHESSKIEEAHRPELLPVVLRLLYGQMINRSGSRASNGGQEARRKLILRTLFRLEESEIKAFLIIGCGPLAEVQIANETIEKHLVLTHDVISSSQQYGFLNMAETILETLQGQLAPFAQVLQTAIVYCLLRATRKLDWTKPEENDRDESISRRNRRLAIHCVDLLFIHCPQLDWKPYLPAIFEEVIAPRLDNFAIETAQGTSGLLHLFSTWASSSTHLTNLNGCKQPLLPSIAACVGVPSARDEVKKFVLEDIIVRLCDTVADNDGDEPVLASTILAPHVNTILSILDGVLRSNPSRTIQDAAILTLSKLSTYATSPESATMLLAPLTLILRQPAEKVSPQTKGNLLKALLNLLRISQPRAGEDLHVQLLDVTSSLFNYFKDRKNRSLLVQVMDQLAAGDDDLQVSAKICADLNAYSASRLDEFDYDRRLEAFNMLLNIDASAYNAAQWCPILYNVLYFSREETDFAIRSNAVATLKVFIQQSSLDVNVSSLTELRRTVVFPALKRALRTSSESVRADHLAMIGSLVQHDHAWNEISDMNRLLANNDEEASFFTNALHIQQHRRLRALRRLEAELKTATISSTNVTMIFLPLLEHFIFDPDEDSAGQNLAGQAIAAVGVCLQATDWPQYRAIFRRYKSFINSKPEMEKNVIKLVSAAADSLYGAAVSTEGQETNTSDGIAASQSRLAKTLPSQQKLSDELVNSFIPDLTKFVHHKEETEISLRIPVAIAAVRLLKILPKDRMALLLPSVLLDVSNILRSRTQESRDTARRTLAEISSILGPTCFGYILKELRTSLARGYQLHVLSFTVHSLLVTMVDELEPGALDYCMPNLVAVVMDDIFGAVGQEKDAEEYISKMREVKSSKSYDSMELLAKIATIQHLVDLVKPVQKLLAENLTSRQGKQVDELLRRIGSGLSRNANAGNRDMLVFSYEIIQEFYKQQQKVQTPRQMNRDENAARFLVNLEGQKHRMPGRSTAVFGYKLVKFALDLLRSTLQKHYDLLEPENVHGFLPIIGDAIVEGQEDVRTSAMRLLSSIIKLPLSELDQNGSLYAMQAVRVIKDSTSTNSEASQAALKLITAIIRDRKEVELRDSDLGYLLNRIAPDLDEPDRQGVTFNFVKAVLARKVSLPEAYDLVDKISVMMVTNQNRGTRDATRGVYVHFLLNYPQSKSRWTKQIKFLVKNIDYDYAEGRQSVMEAIHLLISKSGDETAQDLVGALFVPILLTLSNDDSAQCREMAAALLNQLFARADADQLRSFLASLRSWLEQNDNLSLLKAGMQAYKVYFDADLPGAKKELPFVRSQVEQVLRNDNGEVDEDSWEPVYYAMQLLLKLCASHPESIVSKEQSGLWNEIYQKLDHRHQWIQSASSKLIGSLFHDIGRANAESGLQKLPLSNSHGLKVEAEQMTVILKSSLRIVKSPRTGDDLRLQAVRNIIFLCRCCVVNGLTIATPKKAAIQNGEEVEGEADAAPDSDEEEASEEITQLPALQYILFGLSSNLRREPPQLKSHHLAPKLSSLQLIAAITNISTPDTIPSVFPTQTLSQLLMPLIHLTDPSLPAPRTPDPEFQSTYQQYITSATETLDLLQQKLGSKLYIEEMSKAQKLVRERRQERSRKRKVERVVDPESYALEKKRRREGEKRRRKERAGEHAGRRRGY